MLRLCPNSSLCSTFNLLTPISRAPVKQTVDL
ncbi:hypothetical protein T01_15504 [Trichinella spiralis]|uniref:Uncharacterized protein n=1 Tax=Trichinella spiralis TaxID=6334 RepID=A0A0V0Z036_TRISP|nr:hypothetical protein T01_15504 [Trichinella spiralis]